MGTEPEPGLSAAPEREPARNTVFSAPADDPRARRPVDAFELIVSGIVLLLATWACGAGS